jgi:arylsulfatase A-like enzyme
VPADNLILITIDALRHDALGCVGSSYASTPNLDALAARGVLFEQAIANGPRTQSSFPAIMTSLYPLVAGERRRLPSKARTLAEALSGAGFATAGFNPSNPFLTRETGYHRGFDLFVDFWDAHERTGEPGTTSRWGSVKRRIHDAVGRRSLGFLMLAQALLMEEGGQYLTGRYITDRALAWLERGRGPFFLWLHYMDVHYPYQPIPGQRRLADRLSYLSGMLGLTMGRTGAAISALRTLYGARVALVDELVGDLVRGIAGLGLADTTAVVVTSDHGERLGERGRWAHGPDLHDELIHVPLIITGPALTGPRRIDRQVELLGLAPTVLELVGVPIPPSFLGASFASQTLGLADTDVESVFSEAMHGGSRTSRSGMPDVHTITSCRRQGWKLIHDTEDDSVELFDLTADPREIDNLARECPEKTDLLRGMIEEHRRTSSELASSFGDRENSPDAPDDAEMRRRLASLGYL